MACLQRENFNYFVQLLYPDKSVSIHNCNIQIYANEIYKFTKRNFHKMFLELTVAIYALNQNSVYLELVHCP